MSIAHSILDFFGLHKIADESRYVRRTLLSEQMKCEEHAAEVDDLKERYSAARYVVHLRDAMEASARGELAKGRGEWLNYINRLSADDARMFFADVDTLMESGALVEVLTPEQELEKRNAVMEKWDDYNAVQLTLAKSFGVSSALMHKMVSPTLAAHNDIVALEPIPEGADAAAAEALEEMDDTEAEVWAEDSDEEEEGETNGNEEEQDEDEDEDQGHAFERQEG
jgi:hypothetical protein